MSVCLQWQILETESHTWLVKKPNEPIQLPHLLNSLTDMIPENLNSSKTGQRSLTRNAGDRNLLDFKNKFGIF